jgi:DNA invertase Pin-like site-specific DNA recombinase
VSDVCLRRVGVVASRELSRLSRNSRDWQQLIEVCRIVHTLLVDHEMIYDPRRSNDRLLLGVKGSINEYELDVLRQRAWKARHEKALRGELVIAVPVGFIKSDIGTTEMDPDLRVQEAIYLVFRKFRELGTVRQTLMWFLESGLRLPARHWKGNRWVTVWQRPRYGMVHKLLTHPAYGGAYCYGQTQQVVVFQDNRPRKRTRRRRQEEWLALIPGHHKGYIDWEEHQRNRAVIAENMTSLFPQSPGAPKNGPALLAGLLRCGRCGRKLIVGYTGRAANVTRYICCRGNLDSGEPRCISFGGKKVEEFVVRQALRVVEPVAIEAAITAAEATANRHSDVLVALRRDLEAACYAVDRAWRQYDGVDPENRLVADELEGRWNEALCQLKSLETRIAEEESTQAVVTTPSLEDFVCLAEDLRTVWSDAETSVRLKKRILRTLIHEVIVDTDSTAGEITLTIHWQGGVHTTGSVKRRRRGQNSLHTTASIVDTVRILSRTCPDRAIAGILNQNQLQTGKGNRWTQQRVTSLRAKRKMPRYSQEVQEAEGWMTLTQASQHLKISPSTLRHAAEQKTIPVEHPLPNGPWIFCRRDLESKAAKKLVERTRRRTKKRGAARSPGEQDLLFPVT